MKRMYIVKYFAGKRDTFAHITNSLLLLCYESQAVAWLSQFKGV